MSFLCGLVGLPGVGKTCLFNALAAVHAAADGRGESHRAVVAVPDPRIAPLAAMYNAPKTVPARMELVDVPGLKAGSTADGGRGNRLLAHVKDVDALIHVVRCFEDPAVPHEYPTIDPRRDVETLDLELVVADAQTLQNKLDRLAKKSRTGDAEARRELAACEGVKAALDEGVPVRKQNPDERARQAIRECNLVSAKPVLYAANLKTPADARGSPHAKTLEALARAEGAECVTACARDEAEIAQLSPEDQEIFRADLGLVDSSTDRVVRAAYRTLGLVNFLTAGPKEVHVWTCPAGSKAPAAAGKIHTDMERGFIRMEVMTFDDLMAAGSEAAVAKAGKLRVEGREYVVRDGDIVVVRFNR